MWYNISLDFKKGLTSMRTKIETKTARTTDINIVYA